MLRFVVKYVRYAVAALAAVGFGPMMGTVN